MLHGTSANVSESLNVPVAVVNAKLLLAFAEYAADVSWTKKPVVQHVKSIAVFVKFHWFVFRGVCERCCCF